MKKTLLLSSLCLLLLVLIYTFKSFTLPIFAGNSIASLRMVSINGDQQSVLIRGHNSNAPILLFLHGGPGMPAMFMAHDFQRELEKHFVVVHWDQRGAGKSYRDDVSADELSISALLSDANSVIDYLRDLLQQDKVWLVGHSHGSYLGILYASEYPEKVAAFIGTGQVTHFEREVEVQDAYLRTQLTALGLAADTKISSSNREELLFQTGSEIYGETSFLPLIYSGLKATEYSLFDIANVAKGSSFSSANMTYDRSRNLIQDYRDLSVPVAMIMGAHDMTTPTSLAREYFELINAPQKLWFEFDESAHFPHWEQFELFTETMLELKQNWQ